MLKKIRKLCELGLSVADAKRAIMICCFDTTLEEEQEKLANAIEGIPDDVDLNELEKHLSRKGKLD